VYEGGHLLLLNEEN